MKKPKDDRAQRIASADRRLMKKPVRWEVWDGVGLVQVATDRRTIAVIVYSFFSERDAKAFARSMKRDHVWRVEEPRAEQNRTRLRVMSKRDRRAEKGGE